MGGRSFAGMQITHPPVRSIHLSNAASMASFSSIDIGEVQSVSGICFGELIEKTYMPLHRHYTGHAILGGSKWLAVAKSVDVLTGWEMLHLLEASEAERDLMLLGWTNEVMAAAGLAMWSHL